MIGETYTLTDKGWDFATMLHGLHVWSMQDNFSQWGRIMDNQGGAPGGLGGISAPLSAGVTGFHFESSGLLRLFYLFDVLGEGRQMK